MKEEPTSLVGYCGLYCGACGIRQGRITQAVNDLRGVIGAYGFDKISSDLAKWEPAFEHYQEFEKVMDGLLKIFGGCPGCIGGGGDPNCSVRECCKQKAFTTCADCSNMTICERLRRFEHSLKELSKVKATGAENWAQKMQRKVDAGYCYLDERLK